MLANRLPIALFTTGPTPTERHGTCPAEQSEIGNAMDKAALAGNTRLLYVTLTRARDMLVLVRDTWPHAGPTRLDWLEEVENARKSLWGRTGEVDVDGALVTRENVEWDGDAASARPRTADGQTLRFFEAGTPRDFEPLWFTPSSAKARGYRVAQVEDVRTRITFGGRPTFLRWDRLFTDALPTRTPIST